MIRHYHGLIACTIPVLTLQPPWNVQLQQQEQTPCSQKTQISQNQNRTGFSCVLFAAVYPTIGELLTPPLHRNLINRHYAGPRQHIINVSPELCKDTFSTQKHSHLWFVLWISRIFSYCEGWWTLWLKDLCDLCFFMSLILLFKPDLC